MLRRRRLQLLHLADDNLEIWTRKRRRNRGGTPPPNVHTLGGGGFSPSNVSFEKQAYQDMSTHSSTTPPSSRLVKCHGINVDACALQPPVWRLLGQERRGTIYGGLERGVGGEGNDVFPYIFMSFLAIFSWHTTNTHTHTYTHTHSQLDMFTHKH